MQLSFMYSIVLLYMLIFLVADCVCGVVGTSFLVGVGTSFLVVVGQHEDSWAGSILCHIGWTETHYTKTHVEDSGYKTKLPEVMEESIPTDDKPTIYDFNPRPRVCYRSLGLVRR